MKKKRYQSLVLSQVFLRDRLKALGPDLAAAHFLCHRNCRVRFRGQDHWTQLEADGSLNIPAVYVAGWYIEAIEASTAEIVYEGLQNFRNLEYLKVLNIYVIIVILSETVTPNWGSIQKGKNGVTLLWYIELLVENCSSRLSDSY